MRKLLILVVLLSVFSLANCCKVLGDCFDADINECGNMAGSYSATDCDVNSLCDRVYECYPGETVNCTTDQGNQTEIPGEKACNLNKVFGTCVINDTTYLALIDSDGDNDPDSTDCEINNPSMSWGDLSCAPFYSPASNKGEVFFRILIVIAVLYGAFKLFWKKNNEVKKVIKKKSKKKLKKISKKKKKK